MAKPCNCDECVSDPAYTCCYTGDDVSISAVYIANAYRGHLILSPGGANGAIGGLLHQLDPPQHFSHMGIMVADYDLIRHTTAVPKRLTAEEYYTGSILGVKAPIDGLNPDHVEFGWPGSVTQSVEQVFFADRYGGQTPPGLPGTYTGSDLLDKESPSGRSYTVAAISLDPVSDNGIDWFPALVVKPCKLLENSAIDAALNRIADQALKLYAHYRFYCYTSALIADDPNYWRIPTEMLAAQPDWDPVTMKWIDWSDPARVKWVSAPTAPGVCSVFPWLAVQQANKAGNPKIILDWADNRADALGEAGGACRRALAPEWTTDTPTGIDGLYKYSSASRIRAADWLQDSLSKEVFDSLKQNLAGQGGVMKTVATAIDDVGRGAFIIAAEVGEAAIVALLTPIVGPVVAAVLDAAFAAQLIELLYDMPNDIANQVCTSFAFDCHRGFPTDTRCVDALGREIKDVDSKNWSDAPGDGLTVSPDDIHMFWDAPAAGRGDPREQLFGVYGYNTPVRPVVGVVRKARCELVRSTGVATIQGDVRFRGRKVFGAYVKVNCNHTTTHDAEPGYRLLVRSGGQYKVIARYEDPKIGILYGERVTGKPSDPAIAPGVVLNLDVDVIEPPECMREVIVSGSVRVDEVYASGADHDEGFFHKTLHVQWGVAFFNEEKAQWDVDPNDPVAIANRKDVATAGAGVGDANAGLKIEVSANDDLSINVTMTGTLNPGDDDLSQVVHVFVQKDAIVDVPEFDLDTGGPFNDRAYFRGITIFNGGSTAR
jgi:hypothetical protein